MVSLPQIEANRRNAKSSTGPKTGPGKIVASKNALQHGLLSEEALLPGESSSDFFSFTQNLQAELKPVGELECAFVGRIGSLLWRLKRMGKLEAGILLGSQADNDEDDYGRSQLLKRARLYDATTLEQTKLEARIQAGKKLNRRDQRELDEIRVLLNRVNLELIQARLRDRAIDTGGIQ